mgnify:CR=1 FL=1
MNVWSQAIGFVADADGAPSLETVIGHIRGAVVESGYISRGRITSGLKEAYRPLALDESYFANRIEEALRILELSGDLDEYATAAGRGYAPTPPRQIDWGGSEVTMLGTAFDAGASVAVRRSARDMDPGAAVAKFSLLAELGRPEWRNALVELLGSDAVNEGPAALFHLAQALATSGDRYALDEPNSVAVLSGLGPFFGRADPTPSGRWQRIGESGCFPAILKTGYSSRVAVLNVDGNATTVWFPPSRDIWRWIVVGQTLEAGHPVSRYDPATGQFDFLTEPPRQAERAALLTGIQTNAWSWRLDPFAYSVIESLMGSPR